MAAPTIPIIFPLPTDGGRDKTYSELTRSMSCTCPAGAIIKPSIAPIPGFNMGDIIADQSKLLSAFAAGYSMLTVVMKLISCIIDVLCALVNPFAVISALIRLFGTCLPDFILLLPQLAIPAIILCLIKIILAIITYIITVIIPLLQDIIVNIQNLIEAIDTGNQHAVQAVAFKIVSIFKELLNVVGILAALDAILAMVKALLGLGIGIPCGGGGGSCGGCGEDQCPSIFQNFSLNGTDGQFVVFPLFGESGGGLSFLLRFASISRLDDFLTLHDFFPTGVDYSAMLDIKKIPYALQSDGYYAVTSVNEDGTLNLAQLHIPQRSDGYLSAIFNLNGVPTAVDASSRFARFGSYSPQFSINDGLGNTYIEVIETDNIGAIKNSGTFLISSVYDAHNVILDHLEINSWNIQSLYNPGPGLGSPVIWRKISVPSNASNRPFTLYINHEELIRRNIISIGCHPDVRAAAQGARNRSPDLNVPIPSLPDIDGATSAAIACINTIGPSNMDTQYVIDNYGSIALAAAGAASCVTDVLNNLSSNITSYAGQIYPRIFSLDKSLLTSDRNVQFIGGNIIISVIPIDINGNRLASDLPSGVISVKVFSTFGSLSAVEEIIDAYGVSTGEFRTNLSSVIPGNAQVTATVADRFISDFDTNISPPNYVTRYLSLSFVKNAVADAKSQGSREPLGIAGTEK